MAKKQRAVEQLAEQWAEYRQQRDEEERRQRVMVIAEFDAGDPEATLHALAGGRGGSKIFANSLSSDRSVGQEVSMKRRLSWLESCRSGLSSALAVPVVPEHDNRTNTAERFKGGQTQ